MKQKMSFTDNQTAFEYAIYMMIGSYFAKASCRNLLQEKNRLLQYHEQRRDNQYLMEDICIKYAEKFLRPSVTSRLWKEEVQVRFVQGHDDQLSEVQFISDTYVLRVWGQFAGKKTRLGHELWKRGPKAVPADACPSLLKEGKKKVEKNQKKYLQSA